MLGICRPSRAGFSARRPFSGQRSAYPELLSVAPPGPARPDPNSDTIPYRTSLSRNFRDAAGILGCTRVFGVYR